MSWNNDSGDPKNGPENSGDKTDELNVGETMADAIKRKSFMWQRGFLFDLVAELTSRTAINIQCVEDSRICWAISASS